MRAHMLICTVGGFLTVNACGKSPVSVEDDQYLRHDEFGYTIGLPANLAAEGWSIRANTDASVHDAHYGFGFLAPESTYPPLMVDSAGGSRPSRTAMEWVEHLHTPPPGMAEWTTHSESVEVLDRWPDVVEVSLIIIAPDQSMATAIFARYIVSGDLQLQIEAVHTVHAAGADTADDMIAQLSALWGSAVPRYRQIADTLTLH